MSLARLVFYSAVISGWAAFLGWLLAECIILRGDGSRGGNLGLAFVGGIIGAAIGAGINVVAGWSNTQWTRLLARIAFGLLAGCIGGATGILIGNLAYASGLPRALGFMVLGIGVGIVDGVYERSKSKIRNGLIGGLIGGLVGGILFDPISSAIASGSGISSRATTFVILGICIGAMIGLAQVVLKEAWLTVLDGYRPGRQLILSQPITVLGRADHLQLPFLGPSNKDLEPEHLMIVRQSNGTYKVKDNDSRLGVSLNYKQISESPLVDGDVVKIGVNLVRFNQSKRKGSADAATLSNTAQTTKQPPPPPGRKPRQQPTAAPPAPSNTRPAVASSPPSAQSKKPPGPPKPPPPPGKRKT